MNFATAVTGFGLLMKDSEYKGNVSKQMVIDLASGATTFDPHGFRQELINLVKNWNR